MYIRRLSIQNYRNFGEPAFVLPLKQFTLILGENNIGKTNLLNALCLLFGGDLSVAQSRILELDDFNYASVTQLRRQVADPTIPADGISFPEIAIDAWLIGMNEDQEAVVGDWFTDATFSEARITYRYSLRSAFNTSDWITSQRELLGLSSANHQSAGTGGTTQSNSPQQELWRRVEFPIAEYRYSLYGGGRPANECDAHVLRMLKVELLDALRDARRELIASGENRLLFRILRKNHDSKYADLKASLIELEECVKRNEALRAVRTEVGKLLERVSLATSVDDNTIDFIFSSPDAVELIKKIGMVYGTNPVNVARNGLGRNNLLYISLVLSQLAKPSDAASMSTDAAAFFRVVGIEEPEAHLHPHLQDHLSRNIEAIRDDHEDGMQLLLTSHSTHIAAKLNLSHSVILFNDSTGTLRSHYILEGIDETKESDSIRFLSLYLDATKSRMFFARRLLLVEGIAEQTLLPRLFERHCGSSLERHGATVVNVNGVAFSHFLKVVRNGFFLKCVVLTDRDTGTNSENRATDLKATYEDGQVISVEITNDSTFERDLIAANRNGTGKSLILQALKMTRPTLGKQIETTTGTGDLDVGTCFSAIEHYKAEFAFNLAGLLDKDVTQLEIPPYFERAFSFLV
ncbi:MAG: AAA family ATPase [Planctomycetota bacterium]